MGKICSKIEDENYQECYPYRQRQFKSSSSNQEEMRIQERYQNSLAIEEATTSNEKTVVFTGTAGSGKTSLIYFLKNSEEKIQYQKTQIIEQYQIHFNDKVYDVKDLPRYQQDIKTDA